MKSISFAQIYAKQSRVMVEFNPQKKPHLSKKMGLHIQLLLLNSLLNSLTNYFHFFQQMACTSKFIEDK